MLGAAGTPRTCFPSGVWLSSLQQESVRQIRLLSSKCQTNLVFIIRESGKNCGIVTIVSEKSRLQYRNVRKKNVFITIMSVRQTKSVSQRYQTNGPFLITSVRRKLLHQKCHGTNPIIMSDTSRHHHNGIRKFLSTKVSDKSHFHHNINDDFLVTH